MKPDNKPAMGMQNMKTAVTVFVAMFVLAGAGSALAVNTETVQDEGTNNIQEILQKGDLNDAELIQTSSDNNAEIQQGSKKSDAFENEATILQGGTGYNSAVIDQKGDLNTAKVTQKTGGYNHAKIEQSNFTYIDNSNEADILQEGGYNDASIHQKDVDGNKASIQQAGDYSGMAGISQQGGSNNSASIVQVGTGAANLLHTAAINQGSSKTQAAVNQAVIYQQGDGEAIEVLLENGTTTVVMVGHSASISQKGWANTAGIGQAQDGVIDVAVISQDGTGNMAMGVQGAGGVGPAAAVAGF